MSVTITQVARAARVSVATVSRVLNAKGPAREATRRRVLEAARRMGYIPHGGARSLITRRTDTVGVLLPDLFGEFYSELIRGLDVTARRAGYHLLVTSSHSDRAEIELVLRAMRGRVDGLVVMSPAVDARALEVNLTDGLPVVLLNCRVAGSAFDAVNLDNLGGARAMVRHLVSLGHRRIAFVTGPRANVDAQERLRGYRAGLRAAGLATPRALELAGDFGESSGYEAGRRALGLRPRPTAVFAANDAMAVGVLSALRAAGLRVPDDVAVTGFDDIPIARFLSPPLTTVRVGIADLGVQAAERLIAAVKSGRPQRGRQERVATHLVVRRSCGAPPPEDGAEPGPPARKA